MSLDVRLQFMRTALEALGAILLCASAVVPFKVVQELQKELIPFSSEIVAEPGEETIGRFVPKSHFPHTFEMAFPRQASKRSVLATELRASVMSANRSIGDRLSGDGYLGYTSDYIFKTFMLFDPVEGEPHEFHVEIVDPGQFRGEILQFRVRIEMSYTHALAIKSTLFSLLFLILPFAGLIVFPGRFLRRRLMPNKRLEDNRE